MTNHNMTYAESGVDINCGDEKVDKMEPLARATYGKGVLSGVGGFASLFSLKDAGCDLSDPVLVSGTDGVGTKLLVAIMANRFFDLGQDLLAMCANDILTVGARPLFFLDYFATGALDASPLVEVVSGISNSCKSINCALVGGETAELPGLYQGKHFDLAGFCLGVVERSKIIDGSQTRPGDVIVGLASSGLHSNGFSLARKIIFEKMSLKVGDVLYEVDGRPISVADALLTPTRLYVNSILALLNEKRSIKAMAHITGGGIVGNLPRTLPKGITAHVDFSSFARPPIFGVLKENGPVAADEMQRVFNMGVGYTLVVDKSDAQGVVSTLNQLGESAFVLGDIREGSEPFVLVN